SRITFLFLLRFTFVMKYQRLARSWSTASPDNRSGENVIPLTPRPRYLIAIPLHAAVWRPPLGIGNRGGCASGPARTATGLGLNGLRLPIGVQTRLDSGVSR